MIMIRGIKSCLVKLVLVLIHFVYIVSIYQYRLLPFRSRILSATREEELTLCSYITKI